MISETIDPVAMFDTLNAWGWKDYVIEEGCRFSKGYIAQVRCGNIREMGHPKFIRLFNFYEKNVPRGTLQVQCNVVAPMT